MKGHLDLLLLSTLDRGSAHGYGLVDALRGRSEGEEQLAQRWREEPAARGVGPVEAEVEQPKAGRDLA